MSGLIIPALVILIHILYVQDQYKSNGTVFEEMFDNADN
jgi:hypothetical protein